ncbi:LON peptidase substrate-binding domain-containing protein [Dyella sp. BiH032]|uniref:LON peptidase substrate-binding domain-containing protein n=1 Tax=Dyella sp. BiH032 TaxID=3075430 RepID=UPI0028937A23|nr:LON peptidase substrate-binding domain-containing protein [Dyella sp. BiH032]WNL45829.1 LON peptidase substrate-binding domain-containing protein [Dyella sp. BiH032]
MAETPLSDDLPLFPLSTVLYPRGRLQLRVFEPRYLDMVRECSRRGTGFGVCQILHGREVGEPAVPAAVGTMARIIDFSHGDDGLLGIVAEGAERFRVTRTRIRSDGLVSGQVVHWPAEPAQTVPVEFALLQTILGRLLEHMAPHWRHATSTDYDDASWLGFRLAELLPLEREEHQRMLELTDPLRRLAELQTILPRFQKA